MKQGFEQLFEQMPYLPSEIYSDRGLEFESGKMKAYFKEKGIEKFASRTGDVKAAVAERFIKTMKHRLYKWFSEKNNLRWIGVLPKILKAMNGTVNKATGMTPNSVNPENSGKLWDKLYRKYLFQDNNAIRKSPKFREGNDVRLAKKRKTFEKGYKANFTGNFYSIEFTRNFR